MRTIKSRFFLFILVAVAVGIILSSLFLLGFFSGWQMKLSDALYKEKTPLKNIVIVSIDDKSLQKIGRWPWPRERFVEVLDELENSALIVIDVAFFEEYNEVVDKELGDAIEKLGNVILPVEYISFDSQGKGTEILKTIEPISSGALGLGFVNVFTDSDAITRAIPLTIKGSGEIESYESISLVLYKNFLGRNLSFDENRMLINFVGKPASFKTISFSDVISKKISSEEFDDRIVLIGATSPDLHDDYFVPTSSGKAMPGVEVHASALQTMLTRQFLQNESKTLIVLTIFAASIIIALLLWKLRLTIASGTALGLFFGYLIFCIIMFDRGIIMNIFYPPVAIGFSYLGAITLHYVFARHGKRQVIETFGKYVSKDVVNEIMKDIDKGITSLKGVERDITILFSDIRGFTAVSETLKPRGVVEMLNTYLGEMTNVVFKHKGTLDKYIGDSVMAIFNAPVQQKEHALLAVKAGLDMQKKIAKVHSLKGKKIPVVHCGIGINTGPAIIGNIGTIDRMEYTAIGDSVNLASRLCSFAQGGNVIVSESTYQLVKDRVVVKNLGEIKVKNKKKPITVYKIIKLKKKK